MEKRWLAESMSPVEQAWSALQRSHNPEPGRAPSELDARLGGMIQARWDRVWDGIRDRRYVKQERREIGGLDGRAVFEKSVALWRKSPGCTGRIPRKRNSMRPMGDIALAARSAIGELLQAIRQAPVVNVTDWTVREVVGGSNGRRRFATSTGCISTIVHGATLAVRLALGGIARLAEAPTLEPDPERRMSRASAAGSASTLRRSSVASS